MVIKATVAITRGGWPTELQQQDESGVVTRYQIIISPVRYAFLIRHYNHYCGYVLVPPGTAKLAQGKRFNMPVTYTGTGSRYISWYRIGDNGQLNHKSIVDMYNGHNEWVGFDLSDFESINFEFVRAALIQFAADVSAYIEACDDSTVTG